MTSKKTAKDKRAVLPRSSDYTKEFLADWQRLSRSGRYDMVKLKEVMMLLIAGDESLGAEWLDHALNGSQWKNCRELYVGGDFLLVYKSLNSATRLKSERLLGIQNTAQYLIIF